MGLTYTQVLWTSLTGLVIWKDEEVGHSDKTREQSLRLQREAAQWCRVDRFTSSIGPIEIASKVGNTIDINYADGASLGDRNRLRARRKYEQWFQLSETSTTNKWENRVGSVLPGPTAGQCLLLGSCILLTTFWRPCYDPRTKTSWTPGGEESVAASPSSPLPFWAWWEKTATVSSTILGATQQNCTLGAIYSWPVPDKTLNAAGWTKDRARGRKERRYETRSEQHMKWYTQK